MIKETKLDNDNELTRDSSSTDLSNESINNSTTMNKTTGDINKYEL